MIFKCTLVRIANELGVGLGDLLVRLQTFRQTIDGETANNIVLNFIETRQLLHTYPTAKAVIEFEKKIYAERPCKYHQDEDKRIAPTP
jgi:hypothetical protein